MRSSKTPRAANLCFRGSVLGRRDDPVVFEGAKSDRVDAYGTRVTGSLVRRPAFRLVQASLAVLVFWAGCTEQVTLQARTGEWWGRDRGRTLSISGGGQTSLHLETARPTAVYTL